MYTDFPGGDVDNTKLTFLYVGEFLDANEAYDARAMRKIES